MALPMGGLTVRPIAGRIPFSAIDLYARRYGIAGTDFEALLRLIGEMDAEYLEQTNKKG
jgi:hypothetical protein